jgi:pimeloyl-ACP methyl ester carboxylesterase
MTRQTLHHIDTGTNAGDDKPALVLVHGFTCDHTDWQHQIEALKHRFRIIAVDLNGHGQSPQGEPDPHAMGEELAALLNQLQLQRTILIGHSMGTRVIAVAATLVPVSGLIFVDGSRGASSQEQLSRVLAIRDSQDFAAYAKNLFEPMFTAAVDPAVRQRIVKRAMDMDADWAMTLHAKVASFDLHDLPQILGSVNAPMLVIQCTTRGEAGQRASLQSSDVGTAYTDFVASHFRDDISRVEIIPDTSHFPQFEAADALSKAITGFSQEIF